MRKRHKVLLLDDDEDALEMCRDVLDRLPSEPEIHTATTGARAIALLESEEFSLFVSDLNMPKMDGLQVLAIVRRKFPDLRTAIMTAMIDEQFRARAYGMGVDLYLEKPSSSQEISFLLDCFESLLTRRGQDGGFRGVQSKSLLDIIQLENLSQSSSVLKITNGPTDARIWFQDGDIIDASIQDLNGEPALMKILSLKTGNFEVFPPEADHKRTIFTSCQALLLETVQGMDELAAQDQAVLDDLDGEQSPEHSQAGALSHLAKFKNVEFLLQVPTDRKGKLESWGLENPGETAEFTTQLMNRIVKLGDSLKLGKLQRLQALGHQSHFAMLWRENARLCVGLNRDAGRDEVTETSKGIEQKWAC